MNVRIVFILIYASLVLIFSCSKNDDEIDKPISNIIASENYSFLEIKVEIFNNTGNIYYFINSPIFFSGYFSDYDFHSSLNISPQHLNSINYFPLSSPNKEYKTISGELLNRSVNHISIIKRLDTFEILIKLRKSNNKRLFNESNFAVATNIVLISDEEFDKIDNKLDLVLINDIGKTEYIQDFEFESLLSSRFSNVQLNANGEYLEYFNSLKTVNLKDTITIK